MMSVVTRATVLRTAIATTLMLAGATAARAADNANEHTGHRRALARGRARQGNG